MQQKSSTNLVPDTVLGKSQGSVIGKSQGLFSMGNSSTNFNSNTQKPILTPSQNMRPYTQAANQRVIHTSMSSSTELRINPISIPGTIHQQTSNPNSNPNSIRSNQKLHHIAKHSNHKVPISEIQSIIDNKPPASFPKRRDINYLANTTSSKLFKK